MTDKETEKKKAHLESYLECKADLARLELQLAELKTTDVYPGNKINQTNSKQKDFYLTDYTKTRNELEGRIIKAKYARIQRFQQIQKEIEAMEDAVEKTLLTCRYIRGMKWEDMADEMGYSWQHLHKIHIRALRHFQAGKFKNNSGTYPS